MRTATHSRKTHHPKKSRATLLKSLKKATNSHTRIMKLKKMNRNVMNYVHKKPGQTIGIVTLVSAVLIGTFFAKRYFTR